MITSMTDYTDPKYKNLYHEILLDYHYRFPKFHPIPYPTTQQLEEKNDTN